MKAINTLIRDTLSIDYGGEFNEKKATSAIKFFALLAVLLWGAWAWGNFNGSISFLWTI